MHQPTSVTATARRVKDKKVEKKKPRKIPNTSKNLKKRECLVNQLYKVHKVILELRQLQQSPREETKMSTDGHFFVHLMNLFGFRHRLLQAVT